MIVQAAGDHWQINEVALAWPSKLTSFAAESNPVMNRCGLSATWITSNLM